MSYYAGMRGDYYRGKRGDPFSIGGALKGALGGLITGGPIGAILGGVGGGILGGGGSQAMPGGAGVIVPGLPPTSVLTGLSLVGNPANPPPKKPGLTGVLQRLIPGGSTGYYASKRMNVTNSKALRRAIRRVSGFGKLVQRSKRAIAKANTAVGNKQRPAAKRRFK